MTTSNPEFVTAIQAAINEPNLPNFATLHDSKGVTVMSFLEESQETPLVMVKLHGQIFAHIDRENHIVSINTIPLQETKLTTVVNDLLTALDAKTTCTVTEKFHPNGNYKTLAFNNANGEQIATDAIYLDYHSGAVVE